MVFTHRWADVGCGLLSSSVSFTYPSVDIGHGLPAWSLAFTHWSLNVKRVLATSLVASALQTANIRSAYPHRLLLELCRGVTSHAMTLIDVKTKMCGCLFSTKSKGCKTPFLHNNILLYFHHLFSTFPPLVIHLHQFYFVNDIYNIKTSFICKNMYSMISFTS